MPVGKIANIVKNTLLQTAFSAILPTGIPHILDYPSNAIDTLSWRWLGPNLELFHYKATELTGQFTLNYINNNLHTFLQVVHCIRFDNGEITFVYLYVLG